MEIKLDNGKYTWAFDEKVGRLTCLRHGEPWRDATGDWAVLSLLMRACTLEDVVKKAGNCLVCGAIADADPVEVVQNSIEILKEAGV